MVVYTPGLVVTTSLHANPVASLIIVSDEIGHSVVLGSVKISPLAVLKTIGERKNWETRIRSRRRENFFLTGVVASSVELLPRGYSSLGLISSHKRGQSNVQSRNT